MKTKKQKQFGRDWSDGELKFPKHLTPKIIHSALFIYNSKNEQETRDRVEHCSTKIGDEAMSFAMALLILPTMMNTMAKSEEYKDWQQSRMKTLN